MDSTELSLNAAIIGGLATTALPLYSRYVLAHGGSPLGRTALIAAAIVDAFAIYLGWVVSGRRFWAGFACVTQAIGWTVMAVVMRGSPEFPWAVGVGLVAVIVPLARAILARE